MLSARVSIKRRLSRVSQIIVVSVQTGKSNVIGTTRKIKKTILFKDKTQLSD